VDKLIVGIRNSITESLRFSVIFLRDSL